MTKCKCCKEESRPLSEQYDDWNLRAHSAYMMGLVDEASDCYLHAFQLSAVMLASHEVSELAIDRVVMACLNCFDYCPCYDDETDLLYLEISSSLLLDIVRSNKSDVIRSYALSAYADVTAIAGRLTNYCPSKKADELILHFSEVWNMYSKDLLRMQ